MSGESQERDSRRRYAVSQEPEYEPVSGDYGSYQDEVQALIPENVPMLAAILMEQGLLDEESLAQVLVRQAETGETLAAILFDSGIVGGDQLITALQYRSSYR